MNPAEERAGSCLCPVCGSHSAATIYAGLVDRQWTDLVPSRTFSYVKCRDCGLVYQTPVPCAEEIAAFYPGTGYYAYDPRSIPAPYEAVRRAGQRRSLASLAIARLYLPDVPFRHGGAVLDFGCGVGHYLDAMSAWGWTTWGVEINAPARVVAKGKGHSVVERIDQVIEECGPGRFDLVSMFQSIEHTSDPVNLLSVARDTLRPGGLLVVATPNCASRLAKRYGLDWRGLEAPRHLCVFAPESLELALSGAGYVGQRLSTRFAASDLIGSLALRHGGSHASILGSMVNRVPRRLLNGLAASSRLLHSRGFSLLEATAFRAG